MSSPHTKIVLVLIALAVLGLAGRLLFKQQAQPESPSQSAPREQTRDEEIREILTIPREEPLSEEDQTQIREELSAPRPGGDLTEEEKAEIRKQLQ